MEQTQNKPEFIEAIDELLELPSGTLKGPEQLEDLEGWNSIAMLGFISLADRNGVRVSPRDIARATTVAELLQLLKSKA